MSDPERSPDREAAAWLVRLDSRTVSAETLAAFQDWRADPAHADAYRRVEAVWRRSRALSADPDIAVVTEAALARRGPRRSVRRPAVAWAGAGLAAALALAVGLAVWLPGRSTVSTGVGERRELRLADGSRIQLDTASRVRVRYRDDARLVVLERGQALFQVAHAADRPFSVRAGPTTVTALGTTFDVRREAAAARVTLVQGSVEVVDVRGSARRRWRLAPGQQLRTAPGAARPRAVDAAAETSWSQGRLVFRDLPLRDAVAEMNRYLEDKIVLAAGAPETIAVNGVFKAGDRDAFVAATADLFDLTVSPEPDGGVRLSPAPSVG